MYCLPPDARHSIEALHRISAKLTILIECGWYGIVVRFRPFSAGVAQMVVCWVVAPCTMLSLLCFGRTSCLYLQGDNVRDVPLP